MTPSADSPAESARPNRTATGFAVWPLLLRHKLASAMVVLLVLAVVGFSAVAAVSGSQPSLNDATVCSAWAASSAGAQTAYAHLYLREYGVLPNSNADADVIVRTIDNACQRAAYLGEADDLSVLAAIRRAY